MAQIKGDLLVSRTGDFVRRANQGLIQPADLTGARTLVKHSHYWQRVKTDGAGVQNVVLPDATTLTEGWMVVVENYAAVGGDNINVMHNDGTTLKKSIVPTRAYAFYLTDNSTTNGTWYVNWLEEADASPTYRYVYTFNATTDWGAASGGYYSQTVIGSAHGIGADPMIQFSETVATEDILVDVDQAKVNASGDVIWRVTAGDAESTNTDARFAGKLVII